MIRLIPRLIGLLLQLRCRPQDAGIIYISERREGHLARRIRHARFRRSNSSNSGGGCSSLDWARRLIRRGGPEDTDTNGKGCKVWLLRRHHSLRSLLGDNRRKEVHVPCQAVRGRVQSAQVRILRRGYRLRALRRNHRKEGNNLPLESLRRRLQEETAPSHPETRFVGEGRACRPSVRQARVLSAPTVCFTS